MSGILLNLDSTEFFLAPREEMTREGVQRHADVFVGSQVSALLINTNANRVSYRSDVWDAHWDGFDPTQDENQPFFAGCNPAGRASLYQWIANMAALHAAGVDYPGTMVSRCRERGISPWISIRMNDIHDVDQPDSVMHSTFWKQHPEFRRVPYRFEGWNDRALDYARPEVRDHYLALIRESLERWDVDGLELDWMRFGFHFRPGREEEGGRILETWIAELRALCDTWQERRGHPITLAARVPTRPETARELGLDGARWAQSGAINCLIVAPFFTTTEFDVPLDLWRNLLRGTKVPLAAGLEVNVSPFPGAPQRLQTPETTRANCAAFLNRGADLIYLFNFFPKSHPYWDADYAELIRTVGSLETLAGKARRHVVTYPDTWAPGEPPGRMLPASFGQGTTALRIDTGPRPTAPEASLFVDVDGGDAGELSVRVNTEPITARGRAPFTETGYVPATRYEFGVASAILNPGQNVVEVRTDTAGTFRVVGLEVLVEA